ncbi:MAG: glycosyltransferase [Desulfofustis sp.]|nr:glycosyltransferase [Desulfofustis sp.]
MTEPLNIAVLSIHSSPIGTLGTGDTGGMSIYLLELVRALAERGHKIDIFTRVLVRGDAPLIEYGSRIRIIQLQVPGTENLVKNKLFGYLPDYQREIDKFCQQQHASYHIVHSNYWLSAVVGDSLQSTWGCPHLITFHTLARFKMAARQDHVENPLRVEEESRLLARCDGVMVATATERDQLATLAESAKTPVHLVPLGVDFDRFKPLPDAVEKVTRSRRRPPVILFVGRFDPMKGVDTAVKALALLDEEIEPELHLVGGDSPESEAEVRLVSLVDDLGLQGRVRFNGSVDHQRMPEMYRQADIVVVPSYYESFGLVVLEALASGIPAAVTPTGIAVETIIPDLNGYFAAIGDSRSLARAMTDALALARHQDPFLIRRSVQSYDWSRVADLVFSVYSGALLRSETC